MLRASALGYHAEWTSTDQIPRRAIDSGLVPRLGFLDPDLGGETTRVGATFDWQQDAEDPIQLSTYFIYYRLKLFSNFTYFLDDDVNGDQFAQRDERVAWGARATKDWTADLLDRPLEIQTGVETRLDAIRDVGLDRTVAQQRVSTVRRDDVDQWSGALFGEAVWSPFDWMTAGLTMA